MPQPYMTDTMYITCNASWSTIFSMDSMVCARGYHEYYNVWDAFVGEV